MTVCVAAIYLNHGVIGASDRMLTVGDDTQYEPQRAKIWKISASIAIMTAGDASVSNEVIVNVFKEVRTNYDADPTIWQNVGQVARMYQKHYNALRNEAVENEYLSRLNLTFV